MRGRRNRITLPRYGHRTTIRRAPSRTPPFCARAEVHPVMLERVVLCARNYWEPHRSPLIIESSRPPQRRRQSCTPIKGEKKKSSASSGHSGKRRPRKARRPRAATSAHGRTRTKTETLTKRLSPACSERRGCGRTKTSYAACAANTARDFGYARSAGLARKSWSSRRASRPACRTWTSYASRRE